MRMFYFPQLTHSLCVWYICNHLLISSLSVVFLLFIKSLIYRHLLFCTQTAHTTGASIFLVPIIQFFLYSHLRILRLMNWICCDIDETEEEFSTRLANNLENLILKEGPETVKFMFLFSCHNGSYAICWSKVPEVSTPLPPPPCLFPDCCFHCWTCDGCRWCHPSSKDLFWEGNLKLHITLKYLILAFK